MRLAVSVLLLLLASTTGRAYESICRAGADPCTPGPHAARNRWVGDEDEHRAMWEETVRRSGLPLGVSDAAPFTLRVYTGKTNPDGSEKMVPMAGQQVPAIAPADFGEALHAIDRPGPRTIGEFAQLPDWSYSLWDWTDGNEGCPLDGAGEQTDGETCHDYLFHMGPVNSNHFLPQAKLYWGLYHFRAVARARECDAFAQRLGAQRPRFQRYLESCEREALVLEAIAHHFMQDAWSAGHMWERWGSPDPADFRANPLSSVFVAAVSGLIHGSRSLLQKYASLPIYNIWHLQVADVNDAMTAPTPGVGWRMPGTVLPQPGAGDEYLHQITDDPTYQPQEDQLFRCTVSSLRDVYRQLSTPALGPMGSPDPGSCCVANLLDCFPQRVTNASLLAGAGIDFKDLGGVQRHIPLSDPEQISKTTGFVSAVGYFDQLCALRGPASPECEQGGLQRLADLSASMTMLNAFAKIDPQGTQAASGGIGSIDGIKPNSAYQKAASYVDPGLPWPGKRPFDTKALSLARVFHEAHAGDWCSALTEGSLLKLKRHVLEAVQDGTPEERAASVEVCKEFVGRHVRMWTAGGRTGPEPLCTYAAPDATKATYLDRLPLAGSTLQQASDSWCTCGDGKLDPGEQCDSSAAGGDVACPDKCIAPRHTRKVGGACVYDECTCATEDDVPACRGIAFIRREGCEIGCSAGGDLWLMNPDGSGQHDLTLLTRDVYWGYPAWSPEGKRIAYRFIEKNDSSITKVFVLDVASNHSELVAEIPMGSVDLRDFPASPTWSPEGNKLAIEGVNGIHTIDLDNGNFTTWLAAPLHYRAPDWSPDGASLAVDMFNAIGIMPSGGGAAVAIKPGLVINELHPLTSRYSPPFGNPKWSPDGQRLVYTSYFDARIVVADAKTAGGTAVMLHPDPFGADPGDFGYGLYKDPSWSSDGTRILFTYISYDTTRPLGLQQRADIWSMRPDGTDLERITFTDFEPDPGGKGILEFGPAW